MIQKVVSREFVGRFFRFIFFSLKIHGGNHLKQSKHVQIALFKEKIANSDFFHFFLIFFEKSIDNVWTPKGVVGG